MAEPLLLALLTLFAAGIGTATGFGTSTIMIPIMVMFVPVPIALLFGIVAAWLLPGRYWQAAALALVIVGLAVFVIDYFSIERAEEYAARIEEYAGKSSPTPP